MKHDSARELYHYWDRLRAGQPAPRRGAIEPSDIRRILGDTFLLEVLAGPSYRFRLAGTRVCCVYGRELKGAEFLDLWDPDDRQSVAEVLTSVAEEGAAGSFGFAASNGRGQSVAMEGLVLPLRQRLDGFDRILGVLAPMERPYWLGMHALVSQRITSLRILRPETTTTEPPVLQPEITSDFASQPENRRSSFVVVEGGKR